MFNPDDTDLMIDALERGKSIIFASHNPLIADSDGAPKKSRPGYGAAYLALLTNSPIVPVAVSMIPTKKLAVLMRL